MQTLITSTIITAVIGGIFSFLFARLNKKLDRMNAAQKKRHEENIAIREADRELLLKTSAVTELLARKQNGEGVNGDLKDAEDDLKDTREAVQKLTHHILIEYGGHRLKVKINWKVRLQNKAWCITMAGALLSIIYQIAELLGIAPIIPKEKIMDLITTVLTVLALAGVVIDPTTDGIEDSSLAMTYCTKDEQPKG